MRNANNILKKYDRVACCIPLTLIICVIFSLTSQPCFASDQKNFTKINIDPAFKDLLYSAPDFMCEGGAQLLQKGHETALIGIGKVVPENARSYDLQKLARIGRIRAETAILEFGEGSKISTCEGGKEYPALSSFFQVTESRVKGEIQQLPVIGTWWLRNHRTFCVAVGKILYVPFRKTDAWSGGTQSVNLAILEGQEPFLSLIRACPILRENGGVHGFLMQSGTKVLIAVGSARIRDSLLKARRIARLIAIRNLLEHQTKIRLSSVERLSDREILRITEKGEQYVLLSQFMSIQEERVSGLVKAMPVVAVWKDSEDLVLFVAIGKLKRKDT